MNFITPLWPAETRRSTERLPLFGNVFADGGVAGHDVVLVEESLPDMPGRHRGISVQHRVDQRFGRVQLWRWVEVFLARWWCGCGQGLADGAPVDSEPSGQWSD